MRVHDRSVRVTFHFVVVVRIANQTLFDLASNLNDLCMEKVFKDRLFWVRSFGSISTLAFFLLIFLDRLRTRNGDRQQGAFYVLYCYFKLFVRISKVAVFLKKHLGPILSLRMLESWREFFFEKTQRFGAPSRFVQICPDFVQLLITVNLTDY